MLTHPLSVDGFSKFREGVIPADKLTESLPASVQSSRQNCTSPLIPAYLPDHPNAPPAPRSTPSAKTANSPYAPHRLRALPSALTRTAHSGACTPASASRPRSTSSSPPRSARCSGATRRASAGVSHHHVWAGVVRGAWTLMGCGGAVRTRLFRC